MKLRVGLIGLGKHWESRHRPALRALSDRFEVRAVCDQVSHRAEQAAREFGASAVDGYRALTERPDIDAVMMLGPQWFGALPILAACEMGKAIYCASALDLDPSQASRVRHEIERSGIAFVAEFSRRLAPATLRLKELIATRLGPPRLLFCHNRFSAEPHASGLACEEPYSRGTRDLVELVDWCRYVVGAEPTSVFGLRHNDPAGEADYEMMSLDFSLTGQLGTGAVAQLSASRYLSTHWPEAITFRPPAALQVACERGVAFIDLPSGLVWFDAAGRQMESLESERPVGEQLFAQFHRAVTSLVRTMSGLDDAYKALSIVLAARQSHAEARRIPL